MVSLSESDTLPFVVLDFSVRKVSLIFEQKAFVVSSSFGKILFHITPLYALQRYFQSVRIPQNALSRPALCETYSK